MQLKAILTALVGAAMVVDAADMRRSPIHATLERRQRGGQQQGGGRQQQGGGGQQQGGGGQQQGGGGQQQGGGGNIQLDQDAIQAGSADDGNNPGSNEQAASQTSRNNFINFCSGQTLTNGKQIDTGSCNGIPMGQIPARQNMISAVMINPQNNDQIPAGQTFQIQVQLSNLAAGSFTNATTTYYSAPQALNRQGNVIGHTHVTVQDTGRSLNPKQPLDPQKFAFFKGINDAGNGQGLLSATVTGGLPPGNYRVCSMTSASNHQPVLMPIAQRGAQDDCVRFQAVGGGGGRNNQQQGGGNQQQGGGNQQQGGGNQQQGGGNQQQGGGRQQQGGGGQQQGAGGQQQGAGGLQNNGQVAGGNQQQGGGNQQQGGGNQQQGGGNQQQGGGNQQQGGGGGRGGASQANALGGVAAPAITQSNDRNRPFSVDGNSFTTKGDAVQRACDTQRAACQTGIQQGAVRNVQPQQCDSQLQQCVQELS
ncbi:hypothetical protein ISF_01248 [Cordyceps fumosorosea ARSEF 2679]|uniref:Ribosomal protein s17 n=1 Tax=Cordyceps fumosorosea (strain ARSEF 2679) TaxID=1081104 RepID=A0A168D500_CORFA|nr:hypothetical protein ISF_01248 [Cordyceps fumosorosea ARSEF 2679]OAA72175.1 hypothetical protein ISF_01248 [Cordyceps fumosorosea ARSEF 2679]